MDAGAGGTEAVAGAEVVALVSATGTAGDLGPRGTLAKASVSLASPLLHVILELLHCSLNLCHLDIQVIELLFHDSL